MENEQQRKMAGNFQQPPAEVWQTLTMVRLFEQEKLKLTKWFMKFKNPKIIFQSKINFFGQTKNIFSRTIHQKIQKIFSRKYFMLKQTKPKTYTLTTKNKLYIRT